jgi:predicted thioesterase
MIAARGTASRTVTADLTATVVGSGDLPVFSTPMMIALMEQAACAAIDPYLVAEGHTSVGTHVDVRHIAASPEGALVSASAEVTDVQGRTVTFRVSATQLVGDEEIEIGHGVHTRAIVDRTRFLDSVRRP